jgi:hypothetical protein
MATADGATQHDNGLANRCRMHGGAEEGSGAPKGERNGNWQHGHFTREAMAARKKAREILTIAKLQFAYLSPTNPYY